MLQCRRRHARLRAEGVAHLQAGASHGRAEDRLQQARDAAGEREGVGEEKEVGDAGLLDQIAHLLEQW